MKEPAKVVKALQNQNGITYTFTIGMLCSRWFSCCQCSKSKRRSKNQPAVVEEFRIILLGKTGNGKSSLGNTLVDNKSAFKTGNRASSVTKRCKRVRRAFDNNTRLLSVVDTPGFFDTRFVNQPKENHAEIARSLLLSLDGPHAFFIVLQCNTRFTPEEKKAIEWMDKVFPGYIKYSIVIFTNVDRLDGNETLEDYLNLNSTNPTDMNKDLVELINNCGRRYYGVNNKERNKRRNTRVLMDLIETIRQMLINNGTRYYRSEIVTSIAIAYQKNMEVFKLMNSDENDDENNDDLPEEFTNIVGNAINA